MIEFDPKKRAINLDKHGIDFVDCEAVLYDPQGFTTDVAWPTSLGIEHRHLTTGTNALGDVITVCWTKRDKNERLISARAARKKERKFYYENEA